MNTPLSTAAQAVKDAAQELYADRMARKMAWPLDLPVIAAALKAAAGQVIEDVSPVESILDIAAELDSQS